MEQNGRLGIITSNSWLGTEAGKQFYDAIRYYFNIEGIYTSGTGRWFKNPKVVTTITILTKKEISKSESLHSTTFGIINKSLEEFKDDSKLNTLIDSALLGKELDKNIVGIKRYNQSTINKLLKMNVSINALFHNIEWLYDIKNKLCPISDYFKVIRGERRGWDELFYPAPNHGIEPQYVKKVLKNTKGIHSLKAVTDNDAFCCSRTIEELRNLGHTGALNWINKFANGVNGVGKPLRQVLHRANMQWYEMKDTSTASLITSMNPDKRLFYAKFAQPSFINQRIIGLKMRSSNIDIDICHALLNSMLGMFYIEAMGFGRGLGALDISNENMGKNYMLDPAQLSQKQRKDILNAFKPILNRDIMDTLNEKKQKDRINFEHIVLQAYGIDNYYENIKSSLISMQTVRRSARK